MRKAMLTLGILAVLVTPATLTAQTADASGHSDIDAELRMLVTTPSQADLNRADIQAFLAGDQVQQAAAKMGIDLDDLRRQVRILEADALADIEARLPDDQDPPMAGGEVITITSTTIVIALLIIILVIVA